MSYRKHTKLTAWQIVAIEEGLSLLGDSAYAPAGSLKALRELLANCQDITVTTNQPKAPADEQA